jgi:glycosyltransferase involved in cell wall biosynthesis
MEKNNNLHVAFYLPNLNSGGAERVAVRLMNGMAEKNIKIDLLLNVCQGKFLKDINPQIKITSLGAGRTLKSIIPLISYLKENKPKMIISHLSHINVIMIIAKIFANIDTKSIVVEHNTFTEFQFARMGIRIKHQVLKLCMKIFYNFADKVVGVSLGVSKDITKLLNLKQEKITTIYNPVVNQSLIDDAQKEVKHEWIVNKECPVLLAVGRLTIQKDYYTLLSAVAHLNKKRPLRLIILGTGELLEELRDFAKNLNISEMIDLYGFCDNPYAFMSKVDLFVLSSKWEGLPTVLIEAMACGCPVVSTDCPSGPSEILCDGKYGYLVPVEQPILLANAIERTLDGNNKDDRTLIRDRALEFSVDNSLQSYLTLINLILNK